jgi:LPS-assembly protein
MIRSAQVATILLLIFFLGLTMSVSVLAAPSARMHGITIQADSMTRDSEHEIVELEGNVQVIFQTQHLKAQRAKINLRAKTIDAFGDALVTSTDANIGGDRITLDYESNTGIIYNGYVQSGTVLFEGSIIIKTSDVDYLADDAKYTACTTCPETWSFSGKKIRAELGGYAYIKNSVMRFGTVPIFWLPYLVVPLKSDRQTGLLTPSFASEDPGGLIYSQSFFWAIDRSHDATFTFKSYEQRGPKTLIEYNYMLDERSGGVLKAGFLRDRVFATQERLNMFRPNERDNVLNRWFFNYEHYYELPEGYVQRAQLNNMSDLQYAKDFDTEAKGNYEPALENRVSLTKNSLTQHFSIDASYYINLLQSNPLASNDDAVHRMPEIRFSQAMSKIGDSQFLYTFDLDYVNFARSGPAYDDLNAAFDPAKVSNDPSLKNNRYKANRCSKADWESDPTCYTVSEGKKINSCDRSNWETDPNCIEMRDGRYESGKDLIRTGQRLNISPTIYRAFHIGSSVDVLPKVSYRETQYNFGVGDESSVTRRYVRTEVAMKTTASAIYGDTSNIKANRLKHEIQPEVTYTAIPWIEQPKHPFFGDQTADDVPPLITDNVVDADLNSRLGIQYDYTDRVFDRKLVTLAITNKLTQKTWTGDIPQYYQFFSWRLAQSYDVYLHEKNPSTKHAFKPVQSDLRLSLPHVSLTNSAQYYPYQQVTNSSTTLRLDNDAEDVFSIAYARSLSVPPDTDPDPTKAPDQKVTIAVRKYTKPVDLVAATIYDLNSNATRRVTSFAYGLELKIPGDCASIRLTERFENNKRSRQIDFNFVWDGQSRSSFIRTISGLAPFGI